MIKLKKQNMIRKRCIIKKIIITLIIIKLLIWIIVDSGVEQFCKDKQWEIMENKYINIHFTTSIQLNYPR